MKLELDGLTKEFGDFTAVNHINLTMTNGVYGLLGVNGAGKTTLMRMLCTLLKPTSGTICCNGKDIFSMDSEYRKLLGYLPQDFGFYPEFTVEDYLLYIAALKGIRPVVAKKRVKELIAKVGLSKAAHKKMKKLSGGMKRRAGIAQAMLNNPKILILDEPTAGLDPNERIRFRNLISELSEDRLVLLSTHIVSDIEYIANEIWLMKDGEILHKGSIDELINSMTETVWECLVPKNRVSGFMKMLRYEIKKVFSKSKNRIAVIVLFVILAITSILTINRVEYVDENGTSSVGISAVRDLREAKNQWAGYLTADTLSKALEENRTINSSKEALSDDITEQNKAYAKKQGIAGIMDVIIYAFSDYRDYNYYVTDQISDDEVGTIYERRISTLKNWLESGEERFTQAEKDFMIQKYKKLKTPFYYEYMDGWAALLQNISTFILMLALVIGFLVSGIFSDEFQTKADSIFFSARFGRSRGISAKVGAGFCITTGFYLMFVFLYTFIVLFVLGADGASCPIQLDLWRSVYNITFLQAYLFIVVGGYIGTVFASTLAMIVSALTHSTPTAVIVPFIVLCAFPFLSKIITLPGLCSFFPDQLLEIYLDIKEAGLITLGSKVTTIATVIVPVYAVVCLIFQPILYRVYQKVEIK